MDRRIFINRFARGGLLAAMSLIAGILVSRKQVSLDTACNSNYQCRSCDRLKACQLPEAETERDHG